MASQPNPDLDVRLIAPASHPNLIEGLDVWLRLGLLSDSQVRRLCQENLVCPLPLAVPTASRGLGKGQDFAVIEADGQALVRGVKKPSPQAPTGAQQVWITQVARSFATEIGVIWLLALGVFLVVVSSGVLAASHWGNFSTVVQYAILFGYTLAFWGASVWAASRPQLHLTAHMLRIATLLLIPVNVWMMDGLQLWRTPSGIGVGAIATGLLSILTIRLIHTEGELPSINRLRSLNVVALSWLHWGWAWSWVPLVATYLGTVGTIACLVYQSAYKDGRSRSADVTEALTLSQSTSPPSRTFNRPVTPADLSSQTPFSPIAIAIAGAVLLLAGRAMLMASVPISQLGLMVGLWGWLLVWRSRANPKRSGWSQLGWLLLILGGLATVANSPPWQAIAISGLALWLLADALDRHGRTTDLTALLAVGLQTLGLFWLSIPGETRQMAIDSAIQFTGVASMPYALLSVAVFPYILGIVGLAARLRRKQRFALANHAELLALLLGIGLTAISLDNPVVRSLNLLLSAATLIIFSRQRSSFPTPLIYLTHAVALAAVVSGVDVLLPNLTTQQWVGIFVAGTLVEWSLCTGTMHHRWRRSAWYAGLVLAGLSYWMPLAEYLDSSPWLLTLLLIPGMLTYLARRPNFFQPSVAIALCGAALSLLTLMLQDLDGSRLICLGSATVLMGLNVRPLTTQDASKGSRATAAIAIGFGLALGLDLGWQFIPDRTVGLFLNALALTAGLLWLGWHQLQQRAPPLYQSFAAASNGWAIALSGLNLCLLNFYVSTLYRNYASDLTNPVESLLWDWALATIILLGAIAFRVNRQPTQLGHVGLAWNLEILLLMGVFLSIREGVMQLVPEPNLALGWAGAIAAGLALGMVLIPSSHLGWMTKSWWIAAALLPGVVVLLTAPEALLPSLLLTAAFYAALAKVTGRVRLSYLTLGLILWSGLQWLSERGWVTPFWLGALLGGTLLWVAQIDPDLQGSSTKQQRHWLRSTATGLICLAAIYQSDVEVGGTALLISILAFALSFGFALLGVVFKVRGFLYVGTVAFGFQVLRQVWMFINVYAFLLWIIGILLGSAIIWIAATFESRRTQFNNVLNHWFTELQSWD